MADGHGMDIVDHCRLDTVDNCGANRAGNCSMDTTGSCGLVRLTRTVLHFQNYYQMLVILFFYIRAPGVVKGQPKIGREIHNIKE